MRTLALILALLIAPLARADRYALLDLGSGDEAVIGLHVTADIVRESVRELPGDVSSVVLKLDSNGGLLSEVPALAELISTELVRTHRVVLWIEEASSSAALVAISAPTLAMTEEGVLHGHEPFERLGDLDLELVGEALETTLRVSERCALLGDRPEPLARALVSPTALSVDAAGVMHADTDHEDVVSTGERVVSLDAEAALRLRVADAVASDEQTLAHTLSLGERAPSARADAVLIVHRERISEQIDRARTAKERLEVALEADEFDEPLARRLAGVLDVILVTHPRVGAYIGYDEPRLESYFDRIDERAASSG